MADPSTPNAQLHWIESLFPSVRRRRLLRELGARFEPNGRDEYHFVEGDRRLPIHAERLGGGAHDVEVHPDAVGHWLPPHDSEPLTEERKREIHALFLRYLAIFEVRV